MDVLVYIYYLTLVFINFVKMCSVHCKIKKKIKFYFIPLHYHSKILYTEHDDF